jgi:hypothetical protein
VHKRVEKVLKCGDIFYKKGKGDSLCWLLEGSYAGNKGEGKPRNQNHGQKCEVSKANSQEEYEKKLRRRVEDRIRKDRQALLLLARILDIN